MQSQIVLILLIAAIETITTAVYGRTCFNKNVTESSQFTLASGEVMTIERFTCDNHPALASPDPPSGLQKRQSSACSQSNCVCGIPCLFLDCNAPTRTIQASHCTALAQQLEDMSGPFTIPANEGLGFILQSCEYTAFGSLTQSTQYCFHDMGVAALEIFSVCGTQQGACQGQNNAGFFVDQIAL
ncbi:hypothetical protein CVT26_012482 [Gymnopilus dilepis]|uniref:Cyanovirin-N domain-containing protein n=1 Tax=Gymnopilus dilepis TaxID=231916 RepID=A0A409YCV2_9AGAR|nr:hypothetical protein CVT26_012482 [Gymnopilus dilepis]